MKKLITYHVKYIQSMAQNLIAEFIMNTFVTANGSTSFAITFKEKDSSRFLFCL